MIGDGPVPEAAFDTAGECEIEVGELAELAIEMLADRSVAIERPPPDGSPEDRYVGDPTTMRLLIQEYELAVRPLPQQIADTARFLSQ